MGHHQKFQENNEYFNELIEFYYKIIKNKYSSESLYNIHIIILLACLNMKRDFHLFYKNYINIQEENIKSDKNRIQTLTYLVDMSVFVNNYKNILKYSDLGLTHIKETKSGIQVLTEGLDSKIYHFFTAKAYALIFLNKYSESIEISEQLLKDNPEDIANLDNLGLALIKQGNLEEGVKYINQALELAKDQPGLYYSLGVFYYEKKEYEKALENFNRSKELDKSFSESDIYLEKIKSTYKI